MMTMIGIDECVIWAWRVMIIVAMLASCYYAYKDDKEKEILCMLQAILGATVPIAFHLIK